jgi:general stress protein YciG
MKQRTKELTIKEFASMGGKARAKKLSPQRRTEIAKKAGKASQAKAASTKASKDG